MRSPAPVTRGGGGLYAIHPVTGETRLRAVAVDISSNNWRHAGRTPVYTAPGRR